MLLIDSLEKTISIPVKVINGKIEYFYEGELPELKDGVIGDLILPSYSVKDENFLNTINCEEVVPFIEKNSKLYVYINIEDKSKLSNELLKYIIKSKGELFIEIELLDELQIKLRGSKKPNLMSCKCKIEALDNIEAISLNQAYSLISEKYEIQRKSHTGNVFDKIYIKEKYGFIKLENLRNNLIAKNENKLDLKYEDEV